MSDAFEIVVVLEDLPTIGPSTWRLADAGFLPSDPIPWVVSLHELEVICELVERPSELIHYLQRRRRLDSTRRAWAMDELDYFAHYLTRGLWWPELAQDESVPPERLLSHTDELDAYYMYVRGDRTKKARRPGQDHHPAVKELLDLLDGLDVPGRLDAALGLLDVEAKARRRIATSLEKLKRRSAVDGQAHDLTLVFGDLGITVMTVPPTDAPDLVRDLHAYCTLKKHQQRAARWVGFGGFEGPPELAQTAVVFNEPWRPDAGLDLLVAELPTAGAPARKFDGRTYARELRRRE